MQGLGVVPLGLRLSLKGSSLMSLMIIPFLTADAVPFICFGDGILTLFKYLGTILRRALLGSCGSLWTGSTTFDSENNYMLSLAICELYLHDIGSGVIYYEYEKREKFEDYDMLADAELGTFKIRRFHFDDESFVHPLHSVRFDPDRPYEIPIEALMANKILSSSNDEKSSTRRSRSFGRPTPQYSPRGMPSTQCECSTSYVKGTSSFHYGMASSSLRKPRS
ncbi:hypothetical protein PIB30_039179 [Stylosanthes scabra]|uniref:Uncharacterized protein n=1 Tax=Stylosanthes scabra TaxID=79078 RepID=A0ABU6XFI1_9FABA|nr:hypothetical protein [Stylosanthes scabra]